LNISFQYSTKDYARHKNNLSNCSSSTWKHR